MVSSFFKKDLTAGKTDPAADTPEAGKADSAEARKPDADTSGSDTSGTGKTGSTDAASSTSASARPGASAPSSGAGAPKPAGAGAPKLPPIARGTPPIARARPPVARAKPADTKPARAKPADAASTRPDTEVSTPAPAKPAAPAPVSTTPAPAANRARSEATPSTAMKKGPSEKLPMTIARVNLAREYFKAMQLEEAVALLEAAEREGPPHRDVYRLLGEGYFMLERWRESLSHWYRTSSMTKRDDTKMIGRIHRKVMRCNAQLAMEELKKGDRVAAAEYMAQAVEAVDYPIYLKMRRDMVDPIVAYARDVLETRGAKPVQPADKPLNIIICLDVIKISPVHSHKHLYLSLAASLASLDPRIRVHLVATYERQISWNAGFEDYYRPDNIAALRDFIEEKVPEDLRERISVRYFESFGLRGVITTCEKILQMQPDMILYGGGRTGYHANESLLARHVLHKYVPTGFFFVQSNNDVDEVVDVIIARGDHPLNGDPQDALVRTSPYPPFPGLQAAVVPERLVSLPQDRKRILTAWVGIRLNKTLERYQNNEINRILDLLDRTPDADWHLIGAEEPESLLAFHKRFGRMRKAGRIVVHPVLDYDEFYHMASSAALFFQPPGFTGGGGGASIARNNDVPIICFEHSDVAPLQPQDYVFPEDALDEGIEAAYEMLTDDQARSTLVNKQGSLLELRRSEAPGQFYDAMQAGLAHFKERIKAAPPSTVTPAAAAPATQATQIVPATPPASTALATRAVPVPPVPAAQSSSEADKTAPVAENKDKVDEDIGKSSWPRRPG